MRRTALTPGHVLLLIPHDFGATGGKAITDALMVFDLAGQVS